MEPEEMADVDGIGGLGIEFGKELCTCPEKINKEADRDHHPDWVNNLFVKVDSAGGFKKWVYDSGLIFCADLVAGGEAKVWYKKNTARQANSRVNRISNNGILALADAVCVCY